LGSEAPRGLLEQMAGAWAAQPEPGHAAESPAQLLRQRRPDELWIVLRLWEEAEWPAGAPNLIRRLVTCPNEPARVHREDD
ncbi:MAG: hypothetical protein AB1515_07360, partial [Nitrospirota bacterium]